MDILGGNFVPLMRQNKMVQENSVYCSKGTTVCQPTDEESGGQYFFNSSFPPIFISIKFSTLAVVVLPKVLKAAECYTATMLSIM